MARILKSKFYSRLFSSLFLIAPLWIFQHAIFRYAFHNSSQVSAAFADTRWLNYLLLSSVLIHVRRAAQIFEPMENRSEFIFGEIREKLFANSVRTPTRRQRRFNEILYTKQNFPNGLLLYE